MKYPKIYKIITYLIAAVWVINGLFCKVLHLVPRHELIVGSILGDQYARSMTLFIGFAEIGMAIWILSRYKTRLNAIAQIFIVMTMNVLEFMLVPELLLWGKANVIFAVLFVIVVYYHEFVLKKMLAP